MAEPLPKPTKHAKEIFGLTTAVVSDLVSMFMPGASTLREGLRLFVQQTLARGEGILNEELRKGNIDIITSEAAEAFVPNAFRFFEAARHGEYIHNLKILARLLVEDIGAESPDPGKIGRLARRLQSMSIEDLRVLVAAHRAFETFKASADFDGHNLFVSDNDVLRQLGESYVAPATKVNSHLVDLASRGFLFYGGSPKVIGGHFFYKTNAFDEVISQAISIINEGKD